MKITRGQPLTNSDEETTRELILRRLEADPEVFLAEYTRQFGNVLNADSAATLFDEYNADPAKYRVAVHPAAQWIRDELFRRALECSPPEKFRVVFTAGGNASGKSTAIAFSGVKDHPTAAILDSTLSNYQHASALIAQAMSAGRRVTILYVDRPLDDALIAMLDRAETEGRVVSLHQLIDSQRGAAVTVRKLRDTFGAYPGFTFRFMSNTPAAFREGGVELAQPATYTESRYALDKILDAEYQNGRISETVYRRIKGRS